MHLRRTCSKSRWPFNFSRCMLNLTLWFESFGLQTQNISEESFYSSTCFVTPRGLMNFRIFAATFHWCILILRFTEPERLPAFCYLTNIIFALSALYYTVAASVSFHYTPQREKKDVIRVFNMVTIDYERKRLQIKPVFVTQWLLHSVIVNLSFLVSAMYFLLIYKPSIDRLGLTNISRHILNSVFVLVEFTCNTIPVQMTHVVFSLLLALIYAAYTFIFWYVFAPPENYIYAVINWSEPVKTVKLISGLLVATIIVKFLLVLMTRIKLSSAQCYTRTRTPSYTFLV